LRCAGQSSSRRRTHPQLGGGLAQQLEAGNNRKQGEESMGGERRPDVPESGQQPTHNRREQAASVLHRAHSRDLTPTLVGRARIRDHGQSAQPPHLVSDAPDEAEDQQLWKRVLPERRNNQQGREREQYWARQNDLAAAESISEQAGG